MTNPIMTKGQARRAMHPRIHCEPPLNNTDDVVKHLKGAAAYNREFGSWPAYTLETITAAYIDLSRDRSGYFWLGLICGAIVAGIADRLT